jgi:hypothetical protein
LRTSSNSVVLVRKSSAGPYDGAVVKEGTPGKYQLRAVKPGSRRPLIESYATQDAVAARRAALEQAGYSVLVTLNEGETLEQEGRRIVLYG